MGRSLEWSPAPTAALIRIPTAMDRPRENMKVNAAHESAIWWAARGTAPSQPIMIVAAPNAHALEEQAARDRQPDRGACAAAGPRTAAQTICLGQAARIAGSSRSQVKIDRASQGCARRASRSPPR